MLYTQPCLLLTSHSQFTRAPFTNQNSTPYTHTLHFPHQTDCLVLLITFLGNISEHLPLLHLHCSACHFLIYSITTISYQVSPYPVLTCSTATFHWQKSYLSKIYSLFQYSLMDPHCLHTLILRLGCAPESLRELEKNHTDFSRIKISRTICIVYKFSRWLFTVILVLFGRLGFIELQDKVKLST